MYQGFYFGKQLSTERDQRVLETRLIPGLRQEEYIVTLGRGFVPGRRVLTLDGYICQEYRRARLEKLPGPKSGTVLNI